MPEPLMPAGHYLARGVTAYLSETKTSGKPQIAAQIVILEEGPYANTQMSWYGQIGEHIEDKNRMRVIESLRHLGWTGDNLEENPLPGIGSTDVSVEVKHEEYPKGSGQWSARIAWINQPGAAFAKPMEPNKAKAIGASLRGLVAKVKAGATSAAGTKAASTPPAPSRQAPPRQPAPAPQPQTTGAAMGVEPDDIPF